MYRSCLALSLLKIDNSFYVQFRTQPVPNYTPVLCGGLKIYFSKQVRRSSPLQLLEAAVFHTQRSRTSVKDLSSIPATRLKMEAADQKLIQTVLFLGLMLGRFQGLIAPMPVRPTYGAAILMQTFQQKTHLAKKSRSLMTASWAKL